MQWLKVNDGGLCRGSSKFSVSGGMPQMLSKQQLSLSYRQTTVDTLFLLFGSGQDMKQADSLAGEKSPVTDVTRVHVSGWGEGESSQGNVTQAADWRRNKKIKHGKLCGSDLKGGTQLVGFGKRLSVAWHSLGTVPRYCLKTGSGLM